MYMTNTPNWNRINNEFSNVIIRADRLDALLDALGCNLKTRNHLSYRGPCPVHGGDNDSMCLEVGEGDQLPIRWNCFSNQCHEEFKSSLLGLIRGVLSAQRCRKAPLTDAVEYLRQFTGGISSVQANTHRPRQPKAPKLLKIPRETVRERLTIPSPYFLARGLSPAVLDTFDVGESKTLQRAVVPLYDNDDGQTCIGYLARSYRPLCDQCRMHHDGPNCHHGQPRWKMSEGFPGETYLFNYAAAKATDAPFVFLVEGVGDVFRLAEAGYIGVALLGSEVSDVQLRKLAALKREIWVAFDNDAGGARARELLKQRERGNGISLPSVSFSAPAPFKDIGETPVGELQAAVRGTLEGFISLDAMLAEAGGDPRDVASLEKSRKRLDAYDGWMMSPLSSVLQAVEA